MGTTRRKAHVRRTKGGKVEQVREHQLRFQEKIKGGTAGGRNLSLNEAGVDQMRGTMETFARLRTINNDHAIMAALLNKHQAWAEFFTAFGGFQSLSGLKDSCAAPLCPFKGGVYKRTLAEPPSAERTAILAELIFNAYMARLVIGWMGWTDIPDCGVIPNK